MSAKAGIQHAVPFVNNHPRLRLLDHPLSRMMTTESAVR